MGLRHAVITSVNRDDQADGGAEVFAACIREVRARVPGCAVEVLIPDFKGDWPALARVVEARPDILNHNTETVPRLYRQVRPGARFERSLELLRRAKEAGLLTKSGIMVGLGEEWDEVLETSAASARRAPTSSPSASTCGRACSTCRSAASTRRRSSPGSRSTACRWVRARRVGAAGALLVSRGGAGPPRAGC